ncbi:hypothetical protein K2173_022672 [Erythroxylum novogranatense]|uniref:ADF-H domain-containing protein n=1 Tax=Erythroxylum novogranatense TaxID=1862640 RepID=A0AAV8TNL2_9ROSI|nr:hypothetical protein K2173_022672 [Erythroxylum novogranatense]
MDQNHVVVEKLGEPNDSYEDFMASLPADECRYAVYDFDYVIEENYRIHKIVQRSEADSTESKERSSPANQERNRIPFFSLPIYIGNSYLDCWLESKDM